MTTSHVIQLPGVGGRRYVVELGTPVVYTRKEWSDDWEADASLLVDAVEWGTNPKIHSATLSRRYGYGYRQHAGDRGYDEVSPWVDSLDYPLTGRYVKIAIPFTWNNSGTWENGWRYWYGVVIEEADQRDGAYAYGADRPMPSGRQSWTCYDLSWILQNILITYSVVAKAGSQGFECVQRPLDFNAPTPKAENDAGNATQTTVYYGGTHVQENIHVFSSDVASASTVPWSTLSLVDYLLTVFTGQSSYTVGELCTRIPFRLMNRMYFPLPDWDRPYAATEGRTIKEVLDSVLDRRRLLGYGLEVDESVTPHRVNLIPFSYTASQIWIDPQANAYIPANISLKSIVADAALDVEAFSVQSGIARRYEKIIIQGHPIVCCGTFSTYPGHLADHWTAGEKTAYRTAASGATGYSGWDDWKKQEANDLYRQRDALKRVYSWFGLPRTWNGDCAAPSQTIYPLFPPADQYQPGPPLATKPDFSPWHWPSLRFLPHLPLLDTDTVPDSNRPEYRKMLVFMQFEFDGSTTRYVPLDRLGVIAKTEVLKDGVEPFSASISVQQEAPGFILNISGAKQHVIAKGQWTAIDASEDTADAMLDYRDTLAVTAAVESAYRATVWYPDDGTTEMDDTVDFRNVLVVDYTGGRRGKNRGRVWWIAPGTVTDIDAAGAWVREGATGRFEKDERGPMRQLAKLLYNWYARERRAVMLIVKQPFFDYAPGDYITQSWNGSAWESIGSVVTEIRLDLTGNLPRTTIHTDVAELDLSALI